VKNCGQFRELLEPYALGALDPEERAALEAHLATGCGECAKAVEEARWLVSQLAYAAPEAAPSDMLKGRLMQTVRAEAKAESGQEKPHVIGPKPVIPLWLWAGIAALVLFSAYSAWNTHRLNIELRETNERARALAEERKRTEHELWAAKREAMIMMDPTSVKIALWGQSAHPQTLEAKWHAQLGLCVMGEKVPMPTGNHVLQLWLIPKKEGAKPMPSTMIRPDADGKFVLLVATPPESMDDIKSIAITEEPEGGSGWPTTPILWSGNVS
jgi:anti-sigma-K factor RskA